MQVLIIGDVHGKVDSYVNLLEGYIENSESFSDEFYSVQIGDFGFREHYTKRNELFQEKSFPKEKHFFFGGNHDDYHELPSFHLGDFGTLPFNENVFFIRGAHSIDKNARIKGRDWFSEEQLGFKESMKCLKKYKRKKPEIVLSHDAPSSVVECMFPSKDLENVHTRNFLQELFEFHKPEVWIFGHWHENKEKEIEGTRFICLDELETHTLKKD